MKQCIEYVLEKFGERGKILIDMLCPSAFGFDDGSWCDVEHGCSFCWRTIQQRPEEFDRCCEENAQLLDLVKVQTKSDSICRDDERVIGHVDEMAKDDEGITIKGTLTDEGKKVISHILDSGDRTEFASGAVRDMRVGKGRCDLLPLDVVRDLMPGKGPQSIFDNLNAFQETGDITFLNSCLWLFAELHIVGCHSMLEQMSKLLLEVAIHFEEGAKKYGDDNWKKGIPTHVYIDSAIRHYLKWLRGDNDEPHDRAFCWNILCCIWTCNHKPELNTYRRDEDVSKEDL